LEFILIDTADEVVTQVPRDQFKAPAPRMGIVVIPRADKVMTQASRGQSQLPDQCMDIDIPLAHLMMTEVHGDLSVPSRHMDIAAVPSADKVITRAHVDQPQLPALALCFIATDQVISPHSADPLSLTPSNPNSNPGVIDISAED
jgi:hypothetical protein